MNRIETVFASLRSRGQKALIPYFCAGDPDLETTGRLVEVAVKSHADLIELGVPFSDPLADGPAIQEASQRALASGTTLGGVLGLVSSLRRVVEVPLVLMTYYNPVLHYGLEAFARQADRSGLDGVIVPDLPLEESGELKQVLADHGPQISLIPLVAPTTTPVRMAQIAASGQGFIYCVAVTGVTGPRTELGPEVRDLAAKVRRVSSLPLAIGFGISGPQAAREAARHGDAVIVGSALVQIVARSGGEGTKEKLYDEMANFISGLKQAVNSG